MKTIKQVAECFVNVMKSKSTDFFESEEHKKGESYFKFVEGYFNKKYYHLMFSGLGSDYRVIMSSRNKIPTEIVKIIKEIEPSQKVSWFTKKGVKVIV